MHIEYITGYAGTGKSTALLKQLTTIAGKDKDDTIVLCPTHKAAHRLLPKIPFGIEIKTIHSLLGWIPAINENAEKIEHIDIVAKTDRKIEEYNTFIIDEGGMMSEEMFMELVAKIEDARNFDTESIKIYVYLDPYQLLPVKGRQIQLDEEFTTKLTTQHRAESTDVVALTDMKMVFRLVEATDKQIIADSMNMNEMQEERLARLKPGEAFLFFNKLINS